MLDDLLGLLLSDIEEKTAGDTTVVFDGLQEFGFLLLAHAREFANLALTSELLNALGIADFIGAPNEGDSLWAEALDLQQLQHRGMIFLEQLGVDRQLAFFEHFLEILEHAFADAGNLENLLRFADQIGNLLWVGLDGLGGVAVRADAKRILAVNFEQVGGFVENARNGFVVHSGRTIQIIEYCGTDKVSSIGQGYVRTQ